MFKVRFPLYYILYTLLGVTAFSCRKEATPRTETDIIFLGHKGSGNNGFNDLYMENTIPSISNGLKTLDGVEVDVQMSKDGTLWMFHDPELIYNCDQTNLRSLILLPDSVISKLELCHGNKKDRIYKLQELIDLWNSSPAGFYISMEIKVDFPVDTFAMVGGKDAYLLKLATKLAGVLATRNHAGQLMIEVNSKPFCDELRKSVKGLTIFLISEDDILPQIEKALAEDYEGISCNYTNSSVTADAVKLARDSGLIVQLWTPYYYEELLSAFNRNPTFIQTDNVDVKNELHVQ